MGNIPSTKGGDRIRDFRRLYRHRQVKLSASTETGAELFIKVPNQQSYKGPSPVIPCSLADTPCAKLGAKGVLDKLNATLGTSHTLRTATSSSTSTAPPAPSVQDEPSLESVIEDFIKKEYDFGKAYALLRPVFSLVEPSDIPNELRRCKEKDEERRQKALAGNQIADAFSRPRRVWDLWSNRVVPSWVTDKWPTPISHAWVADEDREAVWTPINGKEWAVPIPKDTDLNLVRIEMLNLGVEYTWLDVLCLRQKEEGGSKEDIRVREWRLDVPTVGRMYRLHEVVVYLSGLGRPLKLKDDDLDSDRSWFRRAWTLQEVGSRRIFAGDTSDGKTPTDVNDVLQTRFEELRSLESTPSRIFAALAVMRKRVSTNPVDRVAGLAFHLQPLAIPAYDENETPENAWTALVNAMDPYIRAGFLFAYPVLGLGPKKWRPTWEQVMTEDLPEDIHSFGMHVRHDNRTHKDWYDGICIEKGLLQGFDPASADAHGRSGELVVETADGIAHTFKICIADRFPIPAKDTYKLLGNDRGQSCRWAIGRRGPDQRFEKVSVIVIDSEDEVARLRDLGLAAESRSELA